HPVLRILLRCRAVHHLVDICRRGLGAGLQQSHPCHCVVQPKQSGIFQKRDCRAPCGGLQ
ncbi:MAG TPA: hypothetical protein PLF72_13970, partial [Anaerolineaceae bacterium]|nr:hypothetical protein [Anaerolineaceae bacterium]